MAATEVQFVGLDSTPAIIDVKSAAQVQTTEFVASDLKETVQKNLDALEEQCRTLSLEERRTLLGDIILRILQIPVTADVKTLEPEAEVSSAVETPAEDKTKYTTGVVGMYNGTKDGAEGFIDYATGKTNLNPPAEIPVTVADIRTMETLPTFANNGYELVGHTTSMTPEQFFASKEPEGKKSLEELYFPEVRALVEKVTGSKMVVPYIFRTRHQFEKPTDFVASRKSQGSALPLAHTDRDQVTGANGVRDVFGVEEGNRLMKKYKRFSQVNVWRGIGQTVNRWPLLFIDTDEVPGGFDYDKNLAKIFSANDPREKMRGVKAHDIVLVDNEHYKYRYASDMTVDEAWVFSSFDSDPSQVAPHGGFWDNSTKPEAPARTSIEVRTWAFFDEVDEE